MRKNKYRNFTKSDVCTDLDSIYIPDLEAEFKRNEVRQAQERYEESCRGRKVKKMISQDVRIIGEMGGQFQVFVMPLWQIMNLEAAFKEWDENTS